MRNTGLYEQDPGLLHSGAPEGISGCRRRFVKAGPRPGGGTSRRGDIQHEPLMSVIAGQRGFWPLTTLSRSACQIEGRAVAKLNLQCSLRLTKARVTHVSAFFDLTSCELNGIRVTTW